MARFTATVPLNIKWNGNEINGAAGATHRIPDALYDEFNAAYSGVIPGLTWVTQDEASATAGFDPATKYDKTGGTIAGAVTVTGALTAPSAYFKGEPWYDVKAYGAVGDGATNDAAAFQAAINAAEAANGGIVFVPADTYLIATTVTISKPGVSIVGVGSHASIVASATTGDTLRIKMDPFTVGQAGRMAGIAITGSTATAAVGVHFGDVIGFHFDDVVIRGFTGASAVGVWADNTTSWTERTLATRLHLDNNKTGLLISINGGSGSFGFTRFLDLRLNVNDAQTGVKMTGAADFYNGVLTILANVASAGTVISMQGTAQVRGCIVGITGEQTSGSGGVGVSVASGAKFWGTGYVRLENLSGSNANAPSNAATYRVMGAGEAQSGVNEVVQDMGSVSWNGSTVPARPVPGFVSRIEEPAGGFGLWMGSNIVSPFLAMYDNSTNIIGFYRVGQSPFSAMTELARISHGGQFSASGGIAFVGALAVSSSSQTAGSGVPTVLAFDSESYDQGSFHSPSSNNSRLTIPMTGKYRFGARVAFASNSTGYRQLSIFLNGGTTHIARTVIPAVIGEETVIEIHTERSFTAGDFIELQVTQNSGSTLTIPVQNYGPHFWASLAGT